MTKNYPEIFDTSKLSESDKKILADFSKRRAIFDEYMRKNRDDVAIAKLIKQLNTGQNELFTCPSCGYPTLREHGGYEICTVCRWEDDNQDDPEADEVWGGPNSNLSLTESRLQIGRTLLELAENLKGTLNVDPEEVLSVLRDREEAIETFSEENITGTTDISDPAWAELHKLEKSTLKRLVKTQ